MGYAAKGDRIVIVGGSHLAAGPDGDEMAGGVHDVVLVHEVEGLRPSARSSRLAVAWLRLARVGEYRVAAGSAAIGVVVAALILASASRRRVGRLFLRGRAVAVGVLWSASLLRERRRSSSGSAATFLASVEQLLFHPHDVVHAAGGAGEAEDALVDVHLLADDAACFDVELHLAVHQPLHQLRFDRGVDRREHLVRDFDRGDAVGDGRSACGGGGFGSTLVPPSSMSTLTSNGSSQVSPIGDRLVRAGAATIWRVVVGAWVAGASRRGCVTLPRGVMRTTLSGTPTARGRVFEAGRRRFVAGAVVFGRVAVGKLVHHVNPLDDVHELDLAVGQHVGHFPGFDRIGLRLGCLRRLVDRAADRGAVRHVVAQHVAGARACSAGRTLRPSASAAACDRRGPLGHAACEMIVGRDGTHDGSMRAR